MDGKQIRLDRFFSRGKAVVVAADHGMHEGPLPGLIDLPKAMLAVDEQADAVLLAPGMLAYCAKTFNYRGGPLAIARINWSSIFAFTWGYKEGANSVVVEPEEAVAMGADMVLVQLTLKTGCEETDARNVEVFSRLCAKAHKLGIPVVGEYFPPDSPHVSADELHDQVYRGVRIISELGADIIKTYYVDDFEKVVETCPVPVVIAGGKKIPEREALEMASSAISAGASGVDMGRNIFQSDDPVAMIQAVRSVVHENATVDDALALYESLKAGVA